MPSTCKARFPLPGLTDQLVHCHTRLSTWLSIIDRLIVIGSLRQDADRFDILYLPGAATISMSAREETNVQAVPLSKTPRFL